MDHGLAEALDRIKISDRNSIYSCRNRQKSGSRCKRYRLQSFFDSSRKKEIDKRNCRNTEKFKATAHLIVHWDGRCSVI